MKKTKLSKAFLAAQRAYQLDLADPLIDEGMAEPTAFPKPLPTGTRYLKGIRTGQNERPSYKPNPSCRRSA